MADPATPPLGIPPTPPSMPPRPVLAPATGPLPPPLPARAMPVWEGNSPPVQAANLYNQPPAAFQTHQLPPGGMSWLPWGIGGVIVVMICLGAAFLVAARRGPATARARTVPPSPAWAPTQAPGGAAAARVEAALTGSPDSVAAPPAAPASPYAPIALPAEREIDVRLKQLWQAAETAGVATRTIKTLKSIRHPDFGIVPVQCEMTGPFPQTVQFLHGLRAQLPAAVIETLELKAPSDAANGSSTAQLTMSVSLYYAPDALNRSSATVPLCPSPDVAGALAELSKIADGTLQLRRIAMNVEGATAAPGTPLRARITVEGLAQSDVDVATVMARLNQTNRVMDLDLANAGIAQVGGQAVRSFVMQFAVKPSEPGTPSAAQASLAAGEVRDVLQAPAWLRPGAKAAPVPAPNGPAPTEATAAARVVQQLQLQSVSRGKKPWCMIDNTIYQIGSKVKGLTIEAIRDDGVVVVRSGNERFELKVKK